MESRQAHSTVVLRPSVAADVPRGGAGRQGPGFSGFLRMVRGWCIQYCIWKCFCPPPRPPLKHKKRSEGAAVPIFLPSQFVPSGSSHPIGECGVKGAASVLAYGIIFNE